MQARKFLIFIGLLVSVLCSTALPQSGSQDDYNTKRQRAIQLFNQNKDLEALPLFEELAAANPKDADVLLGLASGLVSHAATVDEAEATKDRIRARELLLKAKGLGQHSNLLENLLQMLPPDGKMNSSQGPADQAMREGEAAFAKRDFPAAIKAYSKVLELQPKNYSAALYIGDSYFGAQDFNHAGEWYERAIQIDPDRETAYRYYADMLTKEGRMQEARQRAIQAVVAEPYNAIPWRGLQQWAQSNNLHLTRVHINTPDMVDRKSNGNTNITLDPAWSQDEMSAWLIYGMTRANWQNEEFKKHFPKAPQYRHSMAEEVEALSTAASVLIAPKEKSANASSVPANPDLQLLLRLYNAKMLEPYVLLNGADEGIAQDYDDYRAHNRARLEEYLGTFIVPPPPSGSQP